MASEILENNKSAENEKLMQFLNFGMIFSHETAQEESIKYSNIINDYKGLSELGKQDRLKKIDGLFQVIVGGILKKRTAADNFVMGVSGGLDSRAILHYLIANNFTPDLYTFGQIGSMDFDFSYLLSEKEGIKVDFFDTSSEEWQLKWFDESASTTQDVPISPRVIVSRKYGIKYNEFINIHGYLNDAVTGAHLGEYPSQTWFDAVNKFCSANNMFKFQQFMRRPASELLQTKPLASNGILSFDHQLDLCYRQKQRIRLPRDGFKSSYLFPYENMEWIGFWLNQPFQCLTGQNLFIEFARSLKSNLFFDLNEFSAKTKRELRENVTRHFYGSKGAKGVVDVSRTGKIPAAPNSHGHFCFYACYQNNSSFREMISKSLSRLISRNVFSKEFILESERSFLSKEKFSNSLINGLVTTDVMFEAGRFD